jgi:Group XII secretory phospholipase A2 precursor (PLA2G12)
MTTRFAVLSNKSLERSFRSRTYYIVGLLAALVLLQFTSAGLAYAQICGGGAFSRLIASDNWRCQLRHANFSNACRGHDICYWTPGRNKTSCDNDFLRGLKKECHKKFRSIISVGCLAPCLVEANKYYRAVSHVGDGAFSTAREEGVVVLNELKKALNSNLIKKYSEQIKIQIGNLCFKLRDNDSKCSIKEVVNLLIMKFSIKN